MEEGSSIILNSARVSVDACIFLLLLFHRLQLLLHFYVCLQSSASHYRSINTQFLCLNVRTFHFHPSTSGSLPIALRLSKFTAACVFCTWRAAMTGEVVAVEEAMVIFLCARLLCYFALQKPKPNSKPSRKNQAKVDFRIILLLFVMKKILRLFCCLQRLISVWKTWPPLRFSCSCP